MQPEQQRILGYFIEEADEHLQMIERGLLNLQTTIDDAEFANEIFRAAHSVKGGAAMLGLGSISAIAHRLEDAFKLLKERPIRVGSSVEALFLQIFDALHDQVSELQRTGDPDTLDEAGVLAELDPVFQDLQTQLDRLATASVATQPYQADRADRHDSADHTAPVTLPLSQPSEEQSALQLIFHTDVLARLREILRLFQTPETPETRQKICEICRVLAKVGDQFELPQWRHLLDVTHEAISLSSNPFTELATVAIKELKQAQELVLANHESEITISAALQALLPLDPEPHPLFTGSDEEFADLFDDDDELGTIADDRPPTEDDLFAELDLSPVEAPEAALTSRSPLSSKPKRQGPEVGSAELSSLADLFETDMDALDSWENLERNATSTNALGDPDAEDFDGDFADLFASDDIPDTASEARPAEDELDSLFDDISATFEPDSFEPEEPIPAALVDDSMAIEDGSGNDSGNDDDAFDDLFDLLNEAPDAIDGIDEAEPTNASELPDLDEVLEFDDDDPTLFEPEVELDAELDLELDFEPDALDLDLDLEPDSLAALPAADLSPLLELDGLFAEDSSAASLGAGAINRTDPDAADRDAFEDLFSSLDREPPAPKPAAEVVQTALSASSHFLDDEFDDFALFDLDVGEAETFAPPETKPPIAAGDDDLSLDDLFDDLDADAGSTASNVLDLPDLSDLPDPSLTSEDDDDFSELFDGLAEPSTEAIALDDGDDLGDLNGLDDLDDLDLSKALSDVSIDFEQADLDVDIDTDLGADLDNADLSLFPHLEILLAVPPQYAGADVFEALDAYLQQPLSAVASTPPLADDDFADLEHLLETEPAPPTPVKPAAERSTAAPRPSARRPRGRGSAFEQTMRVPIKQLDDLSNLVGELVVNRNSLEDDQERLRQFLDNLLRQVSQLSEVGQRMQDLYERTLLEMALLASRKHRGKGFQANADEGDDDFDALEMDKFSLFHLQAQEIIELVVRVRESSSDIEFLVDENDQVTRQLRQVTTQLQEGLNRSRMVAFENATAVQRLPRGVHDNSIKFGKNVKLQIEGKDMLIDRMILEQLNDPLTHLVNNAIAHGIETPDERLAKGKTAQGTITVSSYNQGNQTIITIADDGAGINKSRVVEKAIQKGLVTKAQAATLTDPEIYDLLFMPGLSTRDSADDLAGRGVGMDVVKTKLNGIRGVIVTDSERDKGTTFTIRLPLTLSISKALCCISDHAPIAFPMDGVSEVLDNLPRERIIREDDDTAYVQWREQKVPYQPLSSLFNYSRLSIRPQMYGSSSDEDTVSVVILRSAGSHLAVSVDSIVGEQEIVIKQLEGPIPKPTGITGATVMGDGHIVPIADVLELIDLSLGRVRRDASSLWDETEEATAVQVEKAEPMVLIIDDSITVRELLSMTFKKSGYRVEQARDGQEAWEKMRSGLPCEIVFCDMEMPRMNGMELLEKMSTDDRLSNLPIAMLTSRTAEKMKRRAGELGAKGYFTKPYLEEVLLDAAQRMLAGENLMSAVSPAEAAPAS